MHRFLLFFVLSIISLVINAQVVVTNPPIVTESGAVEIIFDASQGTAGLKGYTGDVYAHTGVVTNKSTSLSDWKYEKAEWNVNIPACKMTALGNNKWQLNITPDIRTYYGITDAGETVTRLAFVFRSADGSMEGKDTGGKDIFVDVHEAGLTVVFVQPATETAIVLAGTSTLFAIAATEATTIKCLANDVEIRSADNVTELSFNHTFDASGSYEIVAEAGTAPNIARASTKVIARTEPETNPRPAGTRAGINIVDGQTVTLCLYAPRKEFVYVIGDFNDWDIGSQYMLKRDGDYWWITLTGLESGKEYAFQYLVDGDLRIADPYTDKVLDPWNDAYIPASVYPNLKPYPAGKTDGIVSVFQTGQSSYQWQVTDFELPAKENLVIYELLVRDFVAEHSFKAVTQKLDYLQTLGVNAVELMPVNEFEGNDSWGYNPSFYFAVDKYYGPKDDFKALVDACHERGMAVIMDMVLNHSYGQSPFVRLCWDGTAPAADNPWYNVSSPNPTYSWGYDFNHESPQTQALVDSVCSYWMSRYRVDGFRFDFTKGFTNTPGDGWAYDASRISILKRMTNEIRRRKPEAIVIFEHLAENSEEVELADDNILLWGNMNNNYCEAVMGYNESGKSDLSQSIWSQRGFRQPNLIAYMESHDEERMMYKARQYGNSASGYNVKDLNTALSRAGLSACFYLITPGPKMIWQFGELGYEYSINNCTDGTVSNDCRLSPKPVKWDYLQDANRKQLFDTYSYLNQLKREYPVFSTSDFTYSLNNDTKYFIWRSNDMNAFAVGNFGVKQSTVAAILPHPGTWYDAFSGQVYEFTSSYSATLQPGEYRLFTDKAVKEPVTAVDDLIAGESGLVVYPNPVKDILYLNTVKEVDAVKVMTTSGLQVKYERNVRQVNVSGLPAGVYLLQVMDGKRQETVKFVKQ